MKIKTTKVNELSKGKKATVKLSKSLTKKLKKDSAMLSVIDSPEHNLMVFAVSNPDITDDKDAETAINADEAYYKILKILSDNPSDNINDTSTEENVKTEQVYSKEVADRTLGRLERETVDHTPDRLEAVDVINELKRLVSDIEQQNEIVLETLKKLDSEGDNKIKLVIEDDENLLSVHDDIHLRPKRTNAYNAEFGLLMYDNKLFVKIRATNRKGFNIYGLLHQGTLFQCAREKEGKDNIKNYSDVSVISLTQMD